MSNSTSTLKRTYRVVGRYMDGVSVEAYHVVSSDGGQDKLNKNQIIYLAGKGLLENIRIQADGSDIIIRGKGINLNNLPVYDVNKSEIRNSETQNKGTQQLGQLKIVGRIILGRSCLGYVVQDSSGAVFKLKREKVIELAKMKVVENAEVHRYKAQEDEVPKLILRGVGCDFRLLPEIFIDRNGREAYKYKIDEGIIIRANQVIKAGVIHHKDGQKQTFKASDFIVCQGGGRIDVVNGDVFKSSVVKSDEEAICDINSCYLEDYSIEFFGKERQRLGREVLKWQGYRVARRLDIEKK